MAIRKTLYSKVENHAFAQLPMIDSHCSMFLVLFLLAESESSCADMLSDVAESKSPGPSPISTRAVHTHTPHYNADVEADTDSRQRMLDMGFGGSIVDSALSRFVVFEEAVNYVILASLERPQKHGH
jgi:hypothetical protein